MRLSVIIVHWNTAPDLRECLAALRAFPWSQPGGETEILVVDNASSDGAVAMLAAEFPEVRVIANAENLIYAAATNQALKAATGDYFLLLNPDACVTAGAIDKLVGAQKAIVAAKLVSDDGSVQKSVRAFPTPLATITGSWTRLAFDYEKAGPAPQPMMSCLLFTRAVYEKIGGLDERFPLFFNDVDWSYRAERAGLETWYIPEAVVKHGHGGTTKRVRKSAVWESRRAWLRFLKKHFARDPLRPLAIVAVTLDAWRRTGRWGKSLGRDGGNTTPESLCRELECEGRPS